VPTALLLLLLLSTVTLLPPRRISSLYTLHLHYIPSPSPSLSLINQALFRIALPQSCPLLPRV
jgi:hypothetical protein